MFAVEWPSRIADMVFSPDDLDRIAADLAATGEIDTRYSYLGQHAARPR
jgi:hypothetical protein